MDPNEALRQIRAVIRDVRVLKDDPEDMARVLCDRVEALDSWLSQGGFPPEAWREGPDVPAEHIYVPAPERDGAPATVQVAARAAITRQSEESNLERLHDDYHDLLSAVVGMLEDMGVPLPDPDAPETARAAWL